MVLMSAAVAIFLLILICGWFLMLEKQERQADYETRRREVLRKLFDENAEADYKQPYHHAPLSQAAQLAQREMNARQSQILDTIKVQKKSSE